MNVLFLTMSSAFSQPNPRGIYADLMYKFHQEGHHVYIVYPNERRVGKATIMDVRNGITYLGVKTLNLTKTNVIEKGVGQVMMEYQYMHAIKKHLGNVRFDLITYSTPPITFTKVIEWAKRNNPEAVTYLQLKDIFPQNAVDLGMLKTTGLKGILYNSFRKKEKHLYKISDHIGCMSPANVKYVIEHNSEVDPAKVEICPNSMNLQPKKEVDMEVIRKKYNLPVDKPIFFYGGNLGKPQGIPFLVECLKANSHRTDCHFLIVGKGTEFKALDNWVKNDAPANVSLMSSLPKDDYDQLAEACDVGLIFLDYRFTIPNYPSRLLACLMQKKPIIAATDPNCDTGTLAEENGYGFYCPSNDVSAFTKAVDKMLQSDIMAMGEKGFQFYLNNYTVEHTYNAIIKHLK